MKLYELKPAEGSRQVTEKLPDADKKDKKLVQAAVCV